MKSVRNLKVASNVALVALALCCSAGLGSAQDAYKGKFTLPFEARWGSAVLPAGDYTITMPSQTSPYVLYLRGESKSAIILANGSDTKALSDHSQLTLVDVGGRYVIRTLEAGEIGLTLDYALPGAKAKPMAQVLVPMRDVSESAAGN